VSAASASALLGKLLDVGDGLNVRMRLKKLNTFRGSHSHTVRLVGTYVVDFDFCILLYLVTEYNLGTFMDRLANNQADPIEID
jgi:hypothetical protein